jgi:uncharacterized SAM-binding protein YcdF (DUF218 family)
LHHPATDDPNQTEQVPVSRWEERRVLGGLVVRRYRWGLSLGAKLLLIIAILALALITVPGVYPFLAVTERVNADVLVVEGWVHSYRQLFTTGGPVVGKGGYDNDYQTSASVGTESLKKAGIPDDLLQMVPSHVIGRDRTYSSAIALRDWLQKHGMQVRSINIVTEGTHARRTRLLFKRALGANVAVGVIAVPSPDFDAKHWWKYSEGVEEVVQEGIGYLYAALFFSG